MFRLTDDQEWYLTYIDVIEQVYAYKNPVKKFFRWVRVSFQKLRLMIKFTIENKRKGL